MIEHAVRRCPRAPRSACRARRARRAARRSSYGTSRRTRSQRSSKRSASSACSSSSPSPVSAETCGASGKRFASRRRPSGSTRSILFSTSSIGSSPAPISCSTSSTASRWRSCSSSARRRVDDVQHDVGDERLLERRREALDELMRQPADEADRVGDEVPAARRARSRASSGRACGRAGSRPRRRSRSARSAASTCRRSCSRRARSSASRCAAAPCGASRAASRAPSAGACSTEMRRRASRRSVSSCDSPGPRVPTPPPRRSRCCHMPRMRGRLYSSCASSTWSFPSAVVACWAKMSRISCVRSIDARVERVLEEALLRRVELVVDDQALGVRLLEALLQLLELALADVGALRRTGAMLHDRADRLDAGRARELLDLGELVVGDRHPEPARRGRTRARAPGNVESSARLCRTPARLRSPATLELVNIPSRVAPRGGAVRLRRRRSCRSSSVYDDGESLLYAKRTGKPLVLLAGPHRHRPGAGEPPGPDRGRRGRRARRERHEGRPRGDDRARALGRRDASSPTTSALLFFPREELGPAENPLPGVFDAHAARSTRRQLVICLEPTDNTLQLGCLGNLNARVVFEGESAHSARPWLGVNAIALALEGLRPVLELEPRDVEIEGLVFREVMSRDADRTAGSRRTSSRRASRRRSTSATRPTARPSRRRGARARARRPRRRDHLELAARARRAPARRSSSGCARRAASRSSRSRRGRTSPTSPPAGSTPSTSARARPATPMPSTSGSRSPSSSGRFDALQRVPRSVASAACELSPSSPSSRSTRSRGSTTGRPRRAARGDRADRLRDGRPARGDARVHPRGAARRRSRRCRRIRARPACPSCATAIAGWIERRFGVAVDAGRRDRADARLEGGDLLVRAGRARREAARRDPRARLPGLRARRALRGRRRSSRVPLREEHGWLPDLDAFDAWDEIALFWVCYPNNPTGAIAPLSFYEELAGARARARLPRSAPTRRTPSCGSTSRRSRRSQVADRDERRRLQHALEALVDDGVPLRVRLRAARDLRRAARVPADRRHRAAGVRPARVGRRLVGRRARRGRARRSTAASARRCSPRSSERGLRLAGSTATFYLWLDVGGPSEAFARRLLEHGIVVAPGSFFGPAGEGYVRFALVPTQAECERAAEILRARPVTEPTTIDRRARPRRGARRRARRRRLARQRRRAGGDPRLLPHRGRWSRARSARSSTTTRSRSRRGYDAARRAGRPARRRPLRRVPLARRRADAVVREHRRLGRAEHDGRHVGDRRLRRADRRRRAPRGRRRDRRRARAAGRAAGDRRGRRVHRLALHRRRGRARSGARRCSRRT